GVADLRDHGARAGSWSCRTGPVSAGDFAVPGGGACGRSVPPAAHSAMLLCGVRMRVDAAPGAFVARAGFGVAGLWRAIAERSGARVQRAGVAGVSAAGGAGRNISERGGMGVERLPEFDDSGPGGGRTRVWNYGWGDGCVRGRSRRMPRRDG